MTMIEADSYEESCNSDNEPNPSQCKIIEKLIARELIMRLYIEHTTKIESHLYESYSPEYRSMHTID